MGDDAAKPPTQSSTNKNVINMPASNSDSGSMAATDLTSLLAQDLSKIEMKPLELATILVGTVQPKQEVKFVDPYAKMRDADEGALSQENNDDS